MGSLCGSVYTRQSTLKKFLCTCADTFYVLFPDKQLFPLSNKRAASCTHIDHIGMLVPGASGTSLSYRLHVILIQLVIVIKVNVRSGSMHAGCMYKSMLGINTWNIECFGL